MHELMTTVSVGYLPLNALRIVRFIRLFDGLGLVSILSKGQPQSQQNEPWRGRRQVSAR
jgi:hypothetical protein